MTGLTWDCDREVIMCLQIMLNYAGKENQVYKTAFILLNYTVTNPFNVTKPETGEAVTLGPIYNSSPQVLSINSFAFKFPLLYLNKWNMVRYIMSGKVYLRTFNRKWPEVTSENGSLLTWPREPQKIM